MLKIISRFICTGFYSGLSPKAPGTVGTLFCALLMWILWNTPFLVSYSQIPIFSPLNLSCIFLLMGLLLIPLAYTNTVTNSKFDPQEVVIDEFSGFLFTLSLLPPNNLSLILAFIGFRIFDIGKPWPIKLFEKLPGAWGVMLDDVVAGLMAGELIYLFVY